MTDTDATVEVQVTPEMVRRGVIVIGEKGELSFARPVKVWRFKDTDVLVVSVREDD